MAAARGGTLITPSRLTLGQYLNGTWLPNVERRVRPTTADGYRRVISKQIIPALGGAELQAIDTAAVGRWVAAACDLGLSAKTIRNIHGVMSTALADAMRLSLVTHNAAHKAELPTLAAQRARVWNVDQITAFLTHVAADRWAPMWRLLATTGMRRGEALGLRWREVDLEGGTVTITNQRTIAGGVIIEGEPKTSAGRRTISLDQGTLAALKSWRARQAEDRLLMGAGWTGDYVFTWPTGEPLWPQTVTRWFHEHAEALGLPQIGVHGLRHSAATWMIASGESPKVVTHRLGHAHVSITLQLYAHVLPAHDRAAADAFAAVLDNA
jgi:integrase